MLENVTAFSLAVEEAKDLAEFTKQLSFAVLNPPYEEHVKEHVTNILRFVDQGKVMLEPVIEPVTKEYHNIVAALKTKAFNVFKEIVANFDNHVCPERDQLKAWEKEKKLKSVLSGAFDKACGNSSEFLVAMGWAAMILISWTLRRYFIRLAFFVLILPIKILVLPFGILLGSKRGKDKTVSPSKGDLTKGQ